MLIRKILCRSYLLEKASVKEVNGLRLEVGNIMIKDVQFGAKTEVNNGILFVNKEEL
ncbi:MAG TPA: hypothetical protein DDW83_01480, partial [Peptococcaceae bacterium]|nr:hypothetical protein [Peptococcaceae bacterium]